jgi:hypothetical protein
MVKRVRSSLGSFIPASGEALSDQILLRIGKNFKARLISLLPDSSDRAAFIRDAIAEKLEREGV